MKNLFITSLKTKLTSLFLALSIIPLLVAGGLSYKIAAQGIMHETFAELEGIGQSREEAIKILLQGQVGIVKALAKNHILEEMKNPEITEKMINEEMNDAKSLFPTMQEIFVMNAQGKIIASCDKAFVGLDKSRNPYFTKAFDGKKAYIKDVYKSNTTDKIGYVVSAPISSHEKDEIVGVLAVRFNLDMITALTKSSHGLGKTGESYVVNRDNLMITGSRFIGDDVILKTQVTNDAITRARKGENVLEISKDYRGTPVLGYYSKNEHFKADTKLDWIIIVEKAVKEAFAPLYKLRNVMMGVGLISILIIIIVGIYIATLITEPIKELSGISSRIAKGDLTSKITVKLSDEVGVLAGNFSVMINSLKSVLTKLRDATSQITSASNEILSASQEQATGAREQSSAVAETSSAAKELSSTSEQVGASIRRVSEAAGHALAGMGKIKESISKTGGMITSLGERSQKIGKITELIDDVADQTNLLAVNASIEAARAGEQGKGFTVVADEIRKLSNSTAKSTKDITSLIELIQHEMTNSIMSMESSVKSVDEEARLAHETAERSKEIAMSATQQISGSKQIAEAMTNIDEAMKQIASGAQQSQAAVKQLTGLAKELKEIVDKFNIG